MKDFVQKEGAPMTAVLLILKIIGMILLVILGLLILACLVVLFVPVRYRITGEVENSVSVRFRVSWLLGIICFRGWYEDKEYRQKLKLFGIPLKEKNRTSKKKKFSAKREKPDSGKETGFVTKERDDIEARKRAGSKDTVEAGDIPVGGKLKNRIKKIKHFFTVLRKLPGMIRSKMENLKEKIRNFRETAAYIRQEIQDETNREAVRVLFQELKYFLKHASPRKVKAELSFGTEDPAATGQILGIISMLPFIYRYQLNLYPDFETDRFYLKGPFDIKGYVQGVYVLIMGWHLIKDKNIRDLIQRYRNS